MTAKMKAIVSNGFTLKNTFQKNLQIYFKWKQPTFLEKKNAFTFVKNKTFFWNLCQNFNFEFPYKKKALHE